MANKVSQVHRAPLTTAVADNTPVEWAVSETPIEYPVAVTAMEERAARIAAGEAPELIWLLEHPPIYTAGTSAREQDLLQSDRFPVYRTGRGGQFTYHGPGQRIVYVMLNVKRRTGDVRAFVGLLEQWLTATLSTFDIVGETRLDRVGVWVRRPERGKACEDKIAAIGIRVRRWVSYHGYSLNVNPDLEHFSGIVPCGVREHGITSLADLGRADVTMDDVDRAIELSFKSQVSAAIERVRPPKSP